MERRSTRIAALLLIIGAGLAIASTNVSSTLTLALGIGVVIVGAILLIPMLREECSDPPNNLAHLANKLFLTDKTPKAVITRDGNIALSNPAWQEFHPKDSQQSPSTSDFFEFFRRNISDCPVLNEQIVQFGKGQSNKVEGRFRLGDGDLSKWFDLKIETLKGDPDYSLVHYREITPRLEIENQNLNLQSQIKEITDSIPGMVYQFKGTPDGIYTLPFLSEGVRDIYGISPDEGMRDASKLFSLVMEDDLPPLMKSIEAVITNPRRWFHKFRIKTPNGIRQLEACSSPSKIADDGTVTFNGVVLDVTEKTSAQKELDRNRRLLSMTERMAGVGGWQYDLISGKLYWSNQTYRIHGLEPELPAPSVEEAIEFYAPEARPVMSRAVEDGIRNRTGWDLELPFINKAKKHLWVRAIGEPIIENGNVVAMAGTFQDITEQKKVELDLRDVSRRLELAKSAADIGVWQFDPQNEHLVWDDQMFKIFDVSKDEFSHAYEAWSQTVHPNDLQGAERQLQDALEGKAAFHTVFRIVRRSDEAVRYIEAHAHVVRDEDDNPIEVLGINRDVTEAKLAEKEREELQVQKSQAQRLQTIGTLAGGIAHDLNNILTPIMGHADMIADTANLSPDLKEDVDAITNGALRARTIIEKILSFSQRREKQRRQVKIQDLVSEAVSLLRPTLPSRIQINQDVDKSCSPVFADDSELHELIVNLCTNSSHAISGNGTITISLKNFTKLNRCDHCIISNGASERDSRSRIILPSGCDDCNFLAGDYVILSIADSGNGISKDIQDRIFEPFFTTKPVGEGTGMGLAMVFGIVQSHGGGLNLHTDSEGTVFEILLPAIAENAKEATPEKPAGESPATHILLVDDEDAIVTMGERMLSREGHRVTSTTSSEEAFQIFANDPDSFDFVLTDFNMPEMSGVDLLNKIHEIRPLLPAVIMTGLKDNSLKIRDEIRVLKKPILRQELLDELAAAIQPQEEHS